ncbi:hypothetical protein [Streptomyces sp. NPDC046909]|uniref:hypothetical protein n=1 Tax=Streptomyces sp. NPDC046909 TaxID=3155617 RepID=UPI0033F23E6B
MDILETLNANLSHGLTVELTVYDTSPAQLSSCAYAWLTDGVRQFAGSDIVQTAGQVRISSKGFSRVPTLKPHGESNRWSYVSVAPQGTFSVLYNPYAPDSLPWLRRIIDDRPESVSVESGEFTHNGEIGDADVWVSVTFEAELPEYAKLVLYVDEKELVGPETARSTQGRLLQTVQWACNRYNVVFGHVSYRHAQGMTELERFLRFEPSDPILNTPQWRSKLRGYSWLMVVSADVAHMLGGVDTLRRSLVFHSISVLPNGSLLLQATPTFEEFRGAAVRNVQRLMRDVLVTGEFRKPPPVPGLPPTHLIVLPD